jgi:hypothetical protein
VRGVDAAGPGDEPAQPDEFVRPGEASGRVFEAAGQSQSSGLETVGEAMGKGEEPQLPLIKVVTP